MHDCPDHQPMNGDAALAAALRALPVQRPPRDAWPELAARVRRRRSVRRTVWFTLPAAFAACLALALLWPRASLHEPLSAPAGVAQPVAQPAQTATDTRIAALQASSRQWQTWVQNLDDDGVPLNGRALAQAVALQERIGMVDLQLSAARQPATRADLWQQRIILLQRLGLLHLQPYTVADQPIRNAVHTTPM